MRHATTRRQSLYKVRAPRQVRGYLVRCVTSVITLVYEAREPGRDAFMSKEGHKHFGVLAAAHKGSAWVKENWQSCCHDVGMPKSVAALFIVHQDFQN